MLLLESAFQSTPPILEESFFLLGDMLTLELEIDGFELLLNLIV